MLRALIGIGELYKGEKLSIEIINDHKHRLLPLLETLLDHQHTIIRRYSVVLAGLIVDVQHLPIANHLVSRLKQEKDVEVLNDLIRIIGTFNPIPDAAIVPIIDTLGLERLTTATLATKTLLNIPNLANHRHVETLHNHMERIFDVWIYVVVDDEAHPTLIVKKALLTSEMIMLAYHLASDRANELLNTLTPWILEHQLHPLIQFRIANIFVLANLARSNKEAEKTLIEIMKDEEEYDLTYTALEVLQRWDQLPTSLLDAIKTIHSNTNNYELKLPAMLAMSKHYSTDSSIAPLLINTIKHRPGLVEKSAQFWYIKALITNYPLLQQHRDLAKERLTEFVTKTSSPPLKQLAHNMLTQL